MGSLHPCLESHLGRQSEVQEVVCWAATMEAWFVPID